MKSIMRLLIDEIKNIIEDTVVPVISVLTGPSNKKKNSSKERRIQGGVQRGVQSGVQVGDILSPLYSPLYRYSKEGNEIEEKWENGFI